MCKAQSNTLAEFVEEGCVIYEKGVGDLNNDGLEDYTLIVKTTAKENIVINHFNDEVDRNRRGIIVLLNTAGGYRLALKKMIALNQKMKMLAFIIPHNYLLVAAKVICI